MEKISQIGKTLDSMSKGLEVIPVPVWIGTAVVILLCLFCYTIMIPKWVGSGKRRKQLRLYCIYLLLGMYVVLVLGVTLLAKGTEGSFSLQLVPLHSIFQTSGISQGRIQAVVCFLAFLPFGLLFTWQDQGKHKLLMGFAAACIFSLLVEALEFFQHSTFDVDKVLFHVLGAVCGSCLVMVWSYALAGKKAVQIVLRIVVVLTLLAVVSVEGVFGAFHYLRVRGAQGMKENASTVALQMESKEESKTQQDSPKEKESDLVWHNGKAYRYNEDVVTVLCMGIDQNSQEIVQKEQVSGESGQADSIFLVVLDTKRKEMRVIAISRDTMTEIPIFDYKGNPIGEEVNHLGLAYAFGDGKTTSCQYMVDAVSKLFYGIPIHGYAAFNMEAIKRINDAVGGVTVTFSEDLTQMDPSWVSGATVTLYGDSALRFVQWRDNTVDNSNNLRIARQKQYLINFFQQAVLAVGQDYSLPVNLYQSLSEQMVTNIGLDNAVYLATEALSMAFTEENLVMLQGTSKKGSVYDEVYVDDGALYELILDTFYLQEETAGDGN